MTKYKLYDVDANGNRFETNKTFYVSVPPKFTEERCNDQGSIVKDLFALFGFTEYAHMYIVYKVDGGFEIRYNYIDIGLQPTWYLERENE